MLSDSNEENARDDFPNQGLEEIEGIGKARRNWLADLGITTIRDLATIAADALHSQLQEAGHAISIHRVEDWVAAAQSLVEENAYDSENAANSSPRSEAGERRINSPADGHEENSQVEPVDAVRTTGDEVNEDHDWSTIAAFELNYQRRKVEAEAETRIRIAQLQADEPPSWAIVDFHELEPWIRARIPPNLTQATVIKAEEEEPTSQEKKYQLTSLTIAQVRLLKNETPLILSFGSQTTAQWVYANQEFALEGLLNFESTKDTQLNFQEAIQCRYQLVAKALLSNSRDFYFDNLVVLTRSEHKALAKFLLEKISLPSGLYRLELLLSFPQFRHLSAFADISRFQVY